MACWHEFNLTCCLTGGPCIGTDSCSDFISKQDGEAKRQQGYKFSISKKVWEKKTLNETFERKSNHANTEDRRRSVSPGP